MSYKQIEIYKCDKCGKKLKREWWDSDDPKGWGKITMRSGTADPESGVTLNLCPKCAKDAVYIVAVTPRIALDDFGEYSEGHMWLVSEEQLRALARGVPAEDIFQARTQ